MEAPPASPRLVQEVGFHQIIHGVVPLILQAAVARGQPRHLLPLLHHHIQQGLAAGLLVYRLRGAGRGAAARPWAAGSGRLRSGCARRRRCGAPRGGRHGLGCRLRGCGFGLSCAEAGWLR